MLASQDRIKDLGTLQGELLLFGGVYSNHHAFMALDRVASDMGIQPSHRICTGDVAGYCAQSERVLEAVDAGRMGFTIAGNVEQQLANGAGDCGCGFEEGSQCDLASRTWFAEAQRQVALLSAPTLRDWPDMLLFKHDGQRYAVIHGGWSDISRFIWPSCADTVFEEEIALIEQATGRIDAVIAGHSGIPFERHVGDHVWINAGVIGMPPHDGNPETRFAALGADGVRFHSLSYDHEGAAAAMRSVGLVQGYDTALSSGIWPSEDILPHALRR